MKFRCERDALVEAVGIAQRAVTARAGALPVLSGLLITASGGELRLVGSDLEITISATTTADTIEDGMAVMQARLFGDIIRALESGSVTVEADADEARISAGRSDFALRVLPAEEFPRVPEPTGEGVRIDGAILADALRQVVPAASRDDARPILTGVQLEPTDTGLRLVATDSYRLALRDLEGEQALVGDRSVLVPAKALAEVQRLLPADTASEASVVIGEREAMFDLEAARVTTRLIEGEFPNYRQLLPSDYPNRLTVEREPFIEAVKRVRLVAQSREGAPIRLSLSSAKVELMAQAQDVGEAHELVDAKYEGEDMTVAFNPEFLLDGAGVVTGEELILETLDPLKPATLRAVDGAGFLYLLMPVRVS
ncbi:MAG: DNA polymerase III subunit beta [Actinobacteria bacterium]|nr:DNA polymerase III subunit beta [Actinomycetota bacterium]